MRKKWFQLKKNLSRNRLKTDSNATEWFLKQICGTYNIDRVFNYQNSITKIPYIIPASNAWPGRAGSAIKRIKTNSEK